MPGSKKDRKNGKVSGGVVAAVTEHGSRFSSSHGSKASSALTSAETSPPAVQSPDMGATSLPTQHEYMAPSPLLDAVSMASFATSNSPNTREWAKGIPAGIAGSPGNLISLGGETPPTAPSSYEDHRGTASGWSSPRPYHIPSASPPTAPARRPLSFHLDTHYSPPDHVNSLGRYEPSGARRSSMHAHLAQRRNASRDHPPLPHQPQQHFYEAPDLEFDTNPQSGIMAGERGYMFGFDALPASASRTHASTKDSVVIAGYEGGLEVHSISKRGLEHRSSLQGLRGGVYHAKILPWTLNGSDLFPLVAVVIHGPVLPPPAPTINVEDEDNSAVTGSADAKATPGVVDSYQTTVEIYSLASGKHVSTLLEAPKIPLKQPLTSPIFRAPPPTGAFQIKADTGVIVISSGITGECWVYQQAPDVPPSLGVEFYCLGKFWTTLQQPLKGDNQEPEPGWAQQVSPPRPRPQSAIFALSGRWIAYCPAAPSSQIALRASVPVPAQGRAPLLSSLTPPQLPPVNADVDLQLPKGVMNKFMRDATQEILQGAKWFGKQGLQVWNNYWNPSSQPGQVLSRSPPLGPQAWGNTGRSDVAQFPPTHGTVTPPAPKEPGLVAILDADTMSASTSLHPLATFAIPQGCGFLSFSPTGLALFTASSKGDVQTIWDLMRIQYTKSSPLQVSATPTPTGPRVRQVAQFSRMTVARIVDVAWTKPNGQRIAMVTERGTVHLLDLPSSAFTWPPPRRRTRTEDNKGTTAEAAPSAVSLASNALSSVREAARPLMARPRRSSGNTSQASGFSDYATHGGKVLAASISHSIGKTGSAINQLRHTGENRVSLPSTTSLPGPSCVVWMSGKKGHSLYVLGNGLVRLFPTKTRKRAANDEQRVSRFSRYQDFKVPRLADDLIALSVKAYLDPDEYLDLTEGDLDAGNNTLVLTNKTRPASRLSGNDSSIPQAEIESSAPYQPFHTDRRISLFEYGPRQPRTTLAMLNLDDMPDAEGADGEDEAASMSTRRRVKAPKTAKRTLRAETTSLSPAGAWAFGQPIEATKLDTGVPIVSEEEILGTDLEASRALPPSAMERFLHQAEDGAEIVVTTRRRRGAGRGGDVDEDGFFEDDCEVLDFADQRV